MAIALPIPQPSPLDVLLSNLPKRNVVEYRKGQTIYSTAVSSDRVYLVTEGRVLITRVINSDKQLAVMFCQPAEIFGESALVGPVTYVEQAVALVYTKVMSWRAAEIADQIIKQGSLGMSLLQMLVRREAEFMWRLESLALETVRRRLGRSLVQMAHSLGTCQEDGLIRMPPLTHKILSEYVGSTREIVSHHMSEFRRMGYLDYSRDGIVVYRETLLSWC